MDINLALRNMFQYISYVYQKANFYMRWVISPLDIILQIYYLYTYLYNIYIYILSKYNKVRIKKYMSYINNDADTDIDYYDAYTDCYSYTCVQYHNIIVYTLRSLNSILGSTRAALLLYLR